MQRKTEAALGEEQERKEWRASQSEVSQVPLKEGKVGYKQGEMGALRRKWFGSRGASFWLHMEAIREEEEREQGHSTHLGGRKAGDSVLFSEDHVEKHQQ